jgi:uncharacterized protein (DUF4415 family)
MKKKITRYTSESLPPLTGAQKTKLRLLAQRPEKEIDLSDAPEMTRAEWNNAERGILYRPVKRQITARLDADVLVWLKSHGKGYQTRINAILRREMLAAHHSK